MKNKITWEKIFSQFIQNFPNLSKGVIHWIPYSYGIILIFLTDERIATYEYDSNKIIFVRKEK